MSDVKVSHPGPLEIAAQFRAWHPEAIPREAIDRALAELRRAIDCETMAWPAEPTKATLGRVTRGPAVGLALLGLEPRTGQ